MDWESEFNLANIFSQLRGCLFIRCRNCLFCCGLPGLFLPLLL